MEHFKDRGQGFSTSTETSGADWLRQLSTSLTARRAFTPNFATKNEIVRVSDTMRLRLFGRAKGATKTLIIAPLAVHDAVFADLMPGHSLVQTLRETTRGAVYLTDWLPASPETRQFGVDAYLADLNIALDDIGAPVNVVGLSQGGVLAAILAARFPQKIARLVLAGAPLDLRARESDLARQARKLAQARDGLPDDDVIDGAQWLGQLGARQAHERGVIETLQRDPGSFSRADLEAVRFFEDWSSRSLDLPGRYAREMLAPIFAENQLARGSYIALGRPIDLKAIRAPLFVLAGALDEIAPKEQALAALRLAGTPRARTRRRVATCGHFALFMGAKTLTQDWRVIGQWLTSAATAPRAHAIEGKVSSSAP